MKKVIFSFFLFNMMGLAFANEWEEKFKKAVEENDEKTAVQILLKRNIDPNILIKSKNEYGTIYEEPVLIHAIRKELVKLVKALIKKEVNVYARDYAQKFLAQYWAVRSKNKEIVKALAPHVDLNKRYYPENDYQWVKDTVFYVVVELENYDLMEILLKHGAHISGQSDRNPKKSCLARFAGIGSSGEFSKLIQFLINRGANLKSRAYALLEATEAGQSKYANILFESFTNGEVAKIKKLFNRVLLKGVKSMSPEIVEKTVMLGADVNFSDKWGVTPAILVVDVENFAESGFKVAKILSENGLDIDKKNRKGKTSRQVIKQMMPFIPSIQPPLKKLLKL